MVQTADVKLCHKDTKEQRKDFVIMVFVSSKLCGKQKHHKFTVSIFMNQRNASLEELAKGKA